MITRLALLTLVAALTFVTNAPSTAAKGLDRFVGAAPESFSTVDALVDTFKARLAGGDRDSVAKLLGLNPAELAKAEDIDKTFATIRELAAQSVRVKEVSPLRQMIVLGDKLWPFPFPAVKKGDKWVFATTDGIDEVMNRRIGENELEVIATVRAYVDAQEAYKRTDWDADGVLEYAQRLISTPGNYDGLYWEDGEGVPDSPAGPFVSENELVQANDRDIGYYGYHFQVVKGQGDKVAGGRYDYVINGNMIAGFALVAWPAVYGETGVQTFIVNHNGTIYEKDLGPYTDRIAPNMRRFDPDKSWRLTDSPPPKVATVATTKPTATPRQRAP